MKIIEKFDMTHVSVGPEGMTIGGYEESAADKLKRYVWEILEHGPSRVLIDAAGSAVSSLRARRDHGIEPDVIFIRNDGWSLGAPSRLEQAAEALWQKEWVGVMRRPSTVAEPYRKA